MNSTKCISSFTSRRLQPRSWPFGLALLLAGILLSSCRQDSASTSVQASDPSGAYTLITINGSKLPCTPPHEGGAPEVLSGTITLKADGTFTGAMSYKVPSGNTISRDFSGSYTREGDRLILQWKGAGRTTATLAGNLFTMDNEGVLFVYQK